VGGRHGKEKLLIKQKKNQKTPLAPPTGQFDGGALASVGCRQKRLVSKGRAVVRSTAPIGQFASPSAYRNAAGQGFSAMQGTKVVVWHSAALPRARLARFISPFAYCVLR
jgi:hypothetical protein